MPSFTKFCSRLLRLRRPINTSKIDTPPPPSLATTLPDKTPSIVSDAETERMTEVIEDSPESGYQHSRNHESSSGRVYPQAEHVDNASQANRRLRNSACRTHGLLTPHASTCDAHAEESESQDTVIIVKRKFEEAIAQAEEQPSRTGGREDITARFLSPTNFSPSEADTHNLYASVGIQTSRSYTSSWASSSSSIVSRPTRLLNASNPETPVRSPNRTNSGTRTQTIAGSPGPKGPPKRNRTRRHTRSPSPSPASRAAHQYRPVQALSDDATHNVKRKRSFILEGEREQQAVLDDLRYLRTERDRLYAELRRVMQMEKDHTSLFWRPDAPVDLGENDGARPENMIQEPELEGATQSGNRPVDANANVETDSLDYVTLTSEEERRVQSQHEQRLATLVQDTENLAKQSEALASQPEAQPATQTSVHSQLPPQTSDDVPFPLPSIRDTSGSRLHDEATPLRQGQRSPYRNATAPAWPAHLFTSPTRSLGRSSLQASASTPTSNGLGPGFTYGEGTVSDQASFNFIHGRSTLSMHSLEDKFEPPPVRDPDTYFIWFDLETNDAVRPASHTRILEVAVCVTDRNFIRLDNGVSYLVHWPFDAKYIASEMPEKVRTMHETSGLLRAYADTPQEKRLTLQQVEQYVCRYLKKHDIQPTGRGIMAGAGIAFDRGMVRQHMKTLDKYFGHQIFDTSSVWQLVKRKYNRGQRFQERCAHRALEDIYGSMREAKMFSETVLKAPRDVSWPSSSRRN